MNKKILIILSILGLLLLVGGFTYISKSKSGTTSNQITPGSGVSFKDFVPFGGFKTAPINTDTPTDTNPTIPVDTNPITNTDQPSLRKISNDASSGMIALTLKRPLTVTDTTETSSLTATVTKGKSTPLPTTEDVESVRYVDKATGHVFQTYLDTIFPEMISNTTIPKIHSSLFISKGEGVINRYIDDTTIDIQSYSGILTKDSTGSYTSIIGSFLPKNIPDISVSMDTLKYFYLTNTEGGVTGTMVDTVSKKNTQVFVSQFTEWLSQFANPKLITVTTKASARALGYMYAIDPSIKSFDKVLGGITGLTTLTSPDGNKILYSNSINNGFVLNIYDKKTKQAFNLGLTTLPEKCVWAQDSSTAYCSVPSIIPKGEYPDVWYQGIVSFSDALWKLDPINNVFQLVYDPSKENGEIFDGVNLTLSTKNTYLLFQNKKDDQLWALTLK
mgnify:CR=1 FL=1